MCTIAASSDCSTQSFTPDRNCMVELFNDEPAWSLEQPVQIGPAFYTLSPFCAYRCPEFTNKPKHSCYERCGRCTQVVSARDMIPAVCSQQFGFVPVPALDGVH
jgi:hypothetical protein